LSFTRKDAGLRSSVRVVFITTLLFFLLYPDTVFGQAASGDTTIIVVTEGSGIQPAGIISPGDTIKHSPDRAIILSAVLPGLGQVYNKKYWKVPIIYGAEGALLYFIGYNQLKYKKFKDALFEKPTEPVIIDGRAVNPSVLARGRDYYRRWRDLSVLGFAAVYFLNIVDAMVDANFFYYDVSDDLSLNINPALFNTFGNTSAIGLSFQIGF
jgi:hypothetical protein